MIEPHASEAVVALCEAPDKQLQRTVRPARSNRQRAVAELRRHAS